MKKITLLFSAIFALFTISSFAQDSCATAVTATDGVTISTTINDNSPGANDDDSAWYAYTAGADGTITVSACGGGGDTYLNIYNSCGGPIEDTNDDFCDLGNGDAYASQISDYTVISGQTYYIEWRDYWDLTPFDWSITFTPAPSCGEIDALYAASLTDTNIDFYWNDPAFGTPAGYNVEIVSGGNAQGVGVIASGYIASPTNAFSAGNALTAGTDYSIYIQTDCDTDGTSAYAGPINFTTLANTPPANDTCSGAVSLTQETNIASATSATPIAGTLLDAGFTTIAAEECSGFTGDANDDVWYSFTALTADVNITLDSDFDSVLTLYSGADCNSLVYVACSDLNASTPYNEQISASGLTIGATYYFRVYYYNTNTPNPNFTVKLWTSSTLGIDDVVANNNFTYYPNPVKQTLNLKAQSNIQNVAIYNMLGQEVLKTAPNTLDSEVNMSALSNGAYFVKVTINDTTKTVRIIKQ